MKTSKYTKNTALYTYNSSFMKIMEYHNIMAGVTQFSEVERNSIVSPAIDIFTEGWHVQEFPTGCLLRTRPIKDSKPYIPT